MQDGQDADIRSSQGYKELKQSLDSEEQNVSAALALCVGGVELLTLDAS